MTLRKLLAVLFSYDSSDETPISHEEQEMKTFAIQQILPIFGKWLSFIHSLYSSFSHSVFLLFSIFIRILIIQALYYMKFLTHSHGSVLHILKLRLLC